MTIDAARYSVIETLRDGKKVEIRSLRSTDQSGMLHAISRESPQSLRRRFFAVKRNFSERETDFFLNIDFVKHIALVALVEENGKATIIAGGRFVSTRSGEAEVAFSVVDEYQGKGLGSLLMLHLVKIAKGAGYKRLIAEVLPENAPMLKVFDKCGYPITKKRQSGIVHVTLELQQKDGAPAR